MISEAVHMDNMEYMAKFPDKFFDLAIVDPPYGNSTDVMNLEKGKLMPLKEHRLRLMKIYPQIKVILKS